MAVINEFGMPFNDVGGDRTYSSADWRTYFDGLVVSGVMGAVGNELKVAQQTVPNKTVKVDIGSVFIKGAVRQIDTALNLTIADNTSGNSRIDRIVARLNNTDRKIEFAVKQGTPGASAPALTQTATIYEIPLAKIAVANGFSTITTENITDDKIFMTYRDRVLNDKVDAFEASISASMALLNTRMDNMDYAKYYGKYSQMSTSTVSATSAVMNFSTETNDDYTAINLGTSASRMTIGEALNGKKIRFKFIGTLGTDQYSGTGSSVSLRKNGADIQTLGSISSQTAASNDVTGSFESVPIVVATGDYYELYANVAGGDSPTTVSCTAFIMEVLG